MKRVIIILAALLSIFLLTFPVVAGENAQQIKLLEQQLKTLEWENKWLQERLNAIFPKALQDEIMKLQNRARAIQGEWLVTSEEIQRLKTYEVDPTKPLKGE